MRRNRRYFTGIVLCVLSGGFPLPATTQESDPGTVPMELLRTTALGLPFGGSDLPQVLVGGIPERLNGLIPLPEDGRVVGSLDYGAYAITSVAVPDPPAQAEEEWAQGLTSLGWERHAPRPQSGFVASTGEGNQFCLDQSRSISFAVSDGPQGGSYITLISMDNPRFSPCRPRDEPQFRRPESPIPALMVPAGATSGGGGSGGGGDDWRADARLRTELSPSILLDHYAGQLEEEGWVPEARTEADGISVQTFMVSDEHGQMWYAVLTASLPPGQEERLMALRVLLLRDFGGADPVRTPETELHS